jgi:hypothetical protein
MLTSKCLSSLLRTRSLRHRSSSVLAVSAVEKKSPTPSKEINEELKVCEFCDDVLDIVEVSSRFAAPMINWNILCAC